MHEAQDVSVMLMYQYLMLSRYSYTERTFFLSIYTERTYIQSLKQNKCL